MRKIELMLRRDHAEGLVEVIYRVVGNNGTLLRHLTGRKREFISKEEIPEIRILTDAHGWKLTVVE